MVEKYRWAALPANFQDVLDRLFWQKDPSATMKPNMAKQLMQILRDSNNEDKELGLKMIK